MNVQVISFAEKGTPNLVGQFGGGVTIYLQKSKPTKKSCDPKTGAPLSNEVSLVGGVEGFFAHSSCQQENTPTWGTETFLFCCYLRRIIRAFCQELQFLQ